MTDPLHHRTVTEPRRQPVPWLATLSLAMLGLALLPATPAFAADVSGLALPHDLSPWGMFLAAKPVVKGVLLGLVLASVASWTVWLAKTIELITAKSRLRQALAILAAAPSLAEATAGLAPGPVSAFARAALNEAKQSAGLPTEGVKERIASRLERIEAAARQRINIGTGVLATIGAIAPFVGLFGTVWGIMNSFIGISESQTTNLAVVAPGIAEALLATAFGLVAAIPAVVMYNVFARAIGGYRGLLGDAAAEVMILVSRDADRRVLPRAKAAE